ncbi:hypothetical protein AA0616_1047 [Komagataeibacter nataicola NRIC 0616]|nr:hypothetical protein AA0616_1047 [Komagataeibacter nataicola NRIC 0616]
MGLPAHAHGREFDGAVGGISWFGRGFGMGFIRARAKADRHAQRHGNAKPVPLWSGGGQFWLAQFTTPAAP